LCLRNRLRREVAISQTQLIAVSLHMEQTRISASGGMSSDTERLSSRAQRAASSILGVAALPAERVLSCIQTTPFCCSWAAPVQACAGFAEQNS
jgi:hypothetical protein